MSVVEESSRQPRRVLVFHDSTSDSVISTSPEPDEHDELPADSVSHSALPLQVNVIDSDVLEEVDISAFRDSPVRKANTISRQRISVGLNRDLCCHICTLIYNKPSMLPCGHSFCEDCINSWLANHLNCQICHQPARLAHRNLALEQIVEEHKRYLEEHDQDELELQNQRTDEYQVQQQPQGHEEDDRRSTSPSSSVVEIVKPSRPRSMLRSDSYRISQRRKCRFKATLEASPGAALRVPPSLSTRPSKSAMINSSMSHEDSDTSSNSSLAVKSSFHRFTASRRSEMIPRRKKSDLQSGTSSEFSELGEVKFKRSTMLRRSLGAIERSVRKRSGTACNFQNNTCLATSYGMYNAGYVYEPASEENLTRINDKVAKDKSRKPLWKKLLSFKLFGHSGKTAAAVAQKEKQVCIWSSFHPTVCTYSGIGKSFKKINPGEEITIGVFGKRNVGKTSLLDNVVLWCTTQKNLRVVPIGISERLNMGRVGDEPITKERIAHIASLKVCLPNDEQVVVDLIDTDCGGAEDDILLIGPYARAIDAAIMMFSCEETSSILTLMCINRKLHRSKEADVEMPKVIIGNKAASTNRIVERHMAEYTSNNIQAPYFETNLTDIDGAVVKIIEHLCQEVLEIRKLPDVETVIQM